MLDLDIAWVLGCAGLVLLMQPGFMCLESGLTRSKNSINVAVKNLADVGISICLFWCLSYGLMFGTSWHGWIGTNGFFLNIEDSPRLAAFLLFQMMFAGTATTIVSGAVAERLKFQGYVAIAVVISGLIYPVYGHWAWNGMLTGDSIGWLKALGFADFAGSTVVHSIGGWVSLAALLVVGPRVGRFKAGSPIGKIHGSNLPFSVLGAMLLWVGWLGFNGGSTLALNEQVPRIIVHTVLSGGAGMVCAAAWGLWRRRRLEVETLINGSIAGLVSITAGCHAVSTSLAVLIGAIGAIVMLLAIDVIEHYRIDDGVGAVALHGVAGMWGTLAVGLFGDLDLIGTGLGRYQQIGVQMLGIGVAFLWGFGVTYLLLRWLNRRWPLRVSVEAESMGLNVSEHGAKTEVYDLFQVMDQQAQTRDFSLCVPEDPFTEVGKIAHRYNQVMTSLEDYSAQLNAANANLEKTVAQRTAALVAANADLATANAELARMDQMKDDFLANTSHELRTPLNGIIGLSEYLIEGGFGGGSAQARENLALIAKSGRRLYALVDDLLDFSKILRQSLLLNQKAVDLRTLTEIVTTLCHPLIGQKKLSIKNSVAGSLPMVWADENRLQQILYNLVENALKFSDAGVVEINAQVDEADSRIIVTVSDQGMGISPTLCSTIFEPFEQAERSADRAYQGLGLGLAITANLVELHGGEIKVESEVGEGSVFRFDLPIYMSESIRGELDSGAKPASNQTPLNQTGEQLFSVAASPRLARRQPISISVASQQSQDVPPAVLDPTCGQILIVDDDPINLQVLDNFLALSDYQVTRAVSGPAALDLLDQGYCPDLVILDVMMPRMTGYEVTERIRDTWSRDELPIVLLTAKTQLEDEIVGLNAGANDYLTKPILKEGLLARINTQILLRKESLNRQRAQAEKLASEAANKAKSDFLANMSHELRTPLNSIIGFAQLMNRHPALSPQQQQWVDIINRSGEHLLSVINNILDISKIEAGKTSLSEGVFDLLQVLDDMVKLFAMKAQQQAITLTLICDRDVPQHVVSDEGKLRQILTNLIGNGVKFTDAGTVTISVRLAGRPTASQWLRFEVTDTGPGVSSEEQQRLFLPFEQTERGRAQPEGTGLGLAISRQLVSLMGGEIGMQSTLGAGSCFWFEIPVRVSEAVQSPPLSSVAKVVRLAPGQPDYRLLVVDDLLDNRLLLSNALRSVGFVTREADSGQQAVDIAREWRPDLIWMDLVMPGMDGYAALRHIRQQAAQQPTAPAPKIVAMTASVIRDKQTDILAAGFDAYQMKPFHLRDIWRLLERHLGVKFLYQEPVADSVERHVSQPGREITTQAVVVLLRNCSSKWRVDLFAAARSLKRRQVVALINQLSDEKQLLKAGLLDKANAYQFEQICDWIVLSENTDVSEDVDRHPPDLR